MKVLLFLSFVVCCFALKFQNAACGNSACQVQVQQCAFDKYNFTVRGFNQGNTQIFGGEVEINVQYKYFGMWWNAYSAVDPVCGYEGTDCVGGYFLQPNQDKTITLTMGDSTPPAGSYKGTSKFYYLSGNDKTKEYYAHVTMTWDCDNSKCY